MHYAIIAAGEGSRLREEGIGLPKPLVTIQDQPMIDRLLSIMTRCGAESISVICNEQMVEVQQHLSLYREQHPEVQMNLIVQSTPSSMHSLARLSEVIPDGKVCVTTVDTIFRERDFAEYITAFERAEGGLFAVTSFVDDEKPLWVRPHFPLGSDGNFCIENFYDHESQMPQSEPRFVSGGIYGLETTTAWPVLHKCLAEGQSRMRNYQRALISAGIRLQAFVFDQIMDIDHASDIDKANAWLIRIVPQILIASRAPEFSPNNKEKDAAILDAVAERLLQKGCEVTRISEEEFGQLPLAKIQSYDRIVHMMRRMSSLCRLGQCHNAICNVPSAVNVLAQSRELTLTMLQNAGIEVPQWWAYDPEEDEMFQCNLELQQLLPGWVKAQRYDGSRLDDVIWVESPLQADSRVIELAAEHVPDIVVTRHVEGDLLKVYCVAGKHLFLKSFYPQETGYSKFGVAELYNTPLAHHPYDIVRMEQIAWGIARTMGIQVFGFDAIVTPEGRIVVIDVNDWPSFSSFRDEAADAIVQLIIDN